MAKIAVESAPPVSRRLASGSGWAVSDVVCSAGPHDRPFEERHTRTSIAVVLSGTFQYRSHAGSELMTPGSLFLGNAGECFRCGHEHGTGDRCVSIAYEPEFFARLAKDAAGGAPRFEVGRIPPIRASATVIAQASALVTDTDSLGCEELTVRLAAKALQLGHGITPSTSAPPSSLSRVTRVVRMIDNDPGCPQPLESLAATARLSPYHFLRTFEAVTGTTPHQYILRLRLRRAALRLTAEKSKISDIALDSGFGDVSNFNRAFRTEFGVSPRRYRVREGRYADAD